MKAIRKSKLQSYEAKLEADECTSNNKSRINTVEAVFAMEQSFAVKTFWAPNLFTKIINRQCLGRAQHTTRSNRLSAKR